MPMFTLPRAIRVAAIALAVGAGAPAWAQAPAPTAPAAPAPDTDSDRSPGDASTAQEVQLSSRPAIVVSGSAEWEEGFATITKSLNDIRAAMDKANLRPGGKPLAVFVDTDDQGFKYQVMIPLEGPPPAGVNLSAPASVGETPAGKAMKFEHRGPYDDIDSTYEAITAYLDEKGIEAKPMFIEEYGSELKAADDPSLQVDIYVFVK
jgi:effector-binding domain-containing protein